MPRDTMRALYKRLEDAIMKHDPDDPGGEYFHHSQSPQEECLLDYAPPYSWECRGCGAIVNNLKSCPNCHWPEKAKAEIDKPSHYTHGEREAIDYMRDIGVLEPYCVGNIFKYLYRYKHKENPVADLMKARKYIDILVKEIEGRNARG